MNADREATIATLADMINALYSQNRVDQLEAELRTERAAHIRTVAKLETVEALRPHWAQGYSSDGVAAQTMSAALSQLWGLLGVSNQTDAMDTLRKLVTEEHT